MAKDTEKVLEEQIQLDEARIEKDEKKIRRAFLALALLSVLFIANLIFVYFLIIHPRTNQANQAEKIEKPLPIALPTYIPTDELTPTLTNSSNQNIANTTPKDQFIYLGTGNTKSGDWTDISGAQSVFDLGDYVNSEIRFEASVSMEASQIVYVRLYDKTDNHPVWNSEVVANEGLTNYLVSNPIIYDKGRKTYQVQMKTQLGSLTTLGQSRLHITSK